MNPAIPKRVLWRFLGSHGGALCRIRMTDNGPFSDIGGGDCESVHGGVPGSTTYASLMWWWAEEVATKGGCEGTLPAGVIRMGFQSCTYDHASSAPLAQVGNDMWRRLLLRLHVSECAARVLVVQI